MYRPQLLSRVTTWFVAPPTIPYIHTLPADQAGRAFVTGSIADSPLGYLTVMVRRYALELAATDAMRTLVDDAGSVDEDESGFVIDRVEHALPARFATGAGTLVSWQTPAGVVGFDTTWVAGVFRRGTLVWEITVTGTDLDVLVDVVLDLASSLILREGSDPWNLLPDEGDLPTPMRLDAVYIHPRAGHREDDLLAA